MTEVDRPESTEPTTAPAKSSAYSKGDVLHPEWGERPPWFGYIGVGIAFAAMLIGLGVMVLTAIYFWGWIGS